ncbi:MAG TPA: hypothetical protein PK013_02980, partial [Thermosynergistes sp.]|nr:hypothetical protein [Thermosynergistes sp.]
RAFDTQKLLAREVYRHILLEPTCRYQVSVQATEIQLKELGLVCEATVNHLAIESTQGHEDNMLKDG